MAERQSVQLSYTIRVNEKKRRRESHTFRPVQSVNNVESIHTFFEPEYFAS